MQITHPRLAEMPIPAAPAMPVVSFPAALMQTTAIHNGEQAMDFQRAHRIHIKDGSLFVNAYLVLHPRELDPANEASLRRKLALTYSLNSPNFFENAAHTALAVQLGQLLPVSLATERSKLLEEIKHFNERAQGKPDHTLAKQADDEAHPFAAVLHQITEKPEIDPVGAEQLKNGIALTLLLRLKLNQNGYLKSIDDYVPNKQSPDQILHELGEKVGVTSLQMRDAARLGGIDAVGKLLGLSAADVADVKAVTDAMQAHDFSDSLLQHWTLGRAIHPAGTLEQKIAAGMQARIDNDIPQFRTAVKCRYDVPAPVRSEETRIAGALELLEPIQRKLMFALGYEICYTPDKLADDIAFFPGIYGLHRKAADKLSDVHGTYRIYFSGGGGLEQSLRTLVHEVAHNLWPERMGAEEVAKIDAYAASDAARFGRMRQMLAEKGDDFSKLLEAYQAGNDAEKQAIMNCADALFQPYGVHPSALFPYLSTAQEFHVMVDYAYDVLNVEGAQYSRVGYDSPQDRFREVLSRFAELKQVRYRGQPQLLHELAPGLDQIFEAHYLPHLQKLYQDLVVPINDEKGNIVAEAYPNGRHMPFSGQSIYPPALQSPNGVSPQAPTAQAPTEAPRVQEQPSFPQLQTPNELLQMLQQTQPTPPQVLPQAPAEAPRVQEQPLWWTKDQPAPPAIDKPNNHWLAPVPPISEGQVAPLWWTQNQPAPPSEGTTPQAPAAPQPPADKLTMCNSNVAVSPTALQMANIRNLPALAALNAMGVQASV